MREKLKQVTPFIWEIEKEGTMRVPARLFSSEEMLPIIENDRSLWQLSNTATLPGIQNFALAMPDVHEGYGFPIGGVVANDLDDGVISPGGIGYDINCGIRVLKSKFDYDEIKTKIGHLSKEIYRNVPSGVGKGGPIKLVKDDINRVLRDGCKWALKEGYANAEDLEHMESNGTMQTADPDAVSNRAKDRGSNQLGTMGAGNHFVEIDVVDEVLDEEADRAFGLRKNQVVIQIHTGSRGLGHQVATDYIKVMVSNVKKYGINLPDRELSCVPISSPEGKRYFAAMSAAANYAWTNRQLITWETRKAWKNVFGDSGGQLSLLYDVAHNIAKMEEHTINNQKKKVLVHRKGATRAFPANHRETPKKYKAVGQPVLIPGSMGTGSYILVGLPGAMDLTFGSACHGSGRTMSRSAARKKVRGEHIRDEMRGKGIAVESGSMRGLAEESPIAYKDVNSVVNVVEQAGIAKRVVKLKPLGVTKG